MFLNVLSGEELATVRKNRNENPETIGQVETLKKWLLEQPHLPHAWANDDIRLLNFLRGSDFSLDLCKKKLDKYFTVRTSYPELFSNRDVKRDEMQDVFQKMDGVILPDLTPKGRRVSLVRAAVPDFETPNLEEAFKAIFMVGDIRLEHEVEIIDGDVYIIDINFNLAKHFLNVSLLLVRKVFICVQEAYPVLVKEVHIINAPAFVEFVISVIRPFLNEDIRNSIKVHSKMETLYDFVPKEILPEEYGGGGKSVVEYKKVLLKTLEDYTPWFQEQENLKSDESKRPATSSWWFSWS